MSILECGLIVCRICGHILVAVHASLEYLFIAYLNPEIKTGEDFSCYIGLYLSAETKGILQLAHCSNGRPFSTFFFSSV